MNAKPLLRLLAATLAALALAAPAGAAVDLFENRADAKAFRAKVKRDPFALREEAPPPAPPVVEAVKTAEVALEPEVAPPTEVFRVTAIIRVGGRGCAVVNDKTWYLGKMNLGYELVKIEDDRVEIKTPDNRTIQCDLIRERTAAEEFGAPLAP